MYGVNVTISLCVLDRVHSRKHSSTHCTVDNNDIILSFETWSHGRFSGCWISHSMGAILSCQFFLDRVPSNVTYCCNAWQTGYHTELRHKCIFVQSAHKTDTPEVSLHLFHSCSAGDYLQFRSSSLVLFPHTDIEVHITTQRVYRVYADHSLWLNSVLLLIYNVNDEDLLCFSIKTYRRMVEWRHRSLHF